ncbi:MAG: hypothetical protein L0G57_03990 [Acinetobacter sp.]|nr:hypothetical protein [Acinetobacter sp.]
MWRHGCRRWVEVQDVSLTQHEQKQSTALFAAQGLSSFILFFVVISYHYT